MSTDFQYKQKIFQSTNSIFSVEKIKGLLLMFMILYTFINCWHIAKRYIHKKNNQQTTVQCLFAVLPIHMQDRSLKVIF